MVSERRRAERFIEREYELLEDFARGIETGEALHRLVQFIEDQADEATASIPLMAASGKITVIWPARRECELAGPCR